MGVLMEETRPRISIELKLAENLKEEIRKEHGLPATGIIIKKMTHASPIKIEYIIPETGFSNYLSNLMEETDIQDFVELARQRI